MKIFPLDHPTVFNQISGASIYAVKSLSVFIEKKKLFFCATQKIALSNLIARLEDKYTLKSKKTSQGFDILTSDNLLSSLTLILCHRFMLPMRHVFVKLQLFCI